MGEALKVLVGPDADGMSASTVSRLKRIWAQEYRSWCEDCLDKGRWVNERGEKHFLEIEDGVRESTQSWREVLLKLKSRGMNTPELAIGDGTMGFWVALEEIYPQSRQAALLDAQEHERAQLPADISSGEGQAGTA